MVEVFSGNTPLPGAQVQLYARQPAELLAFPAQWSGVDSGVTGADGRWTPPTAPGSYYVAVHAEGLAPGYATVVQPPGPAKTRVPVHLKPAVELSGHVLEKGTGEPIPFAEILLTPPGFMASPQGRLDAPEDEGLLATSNETGQFELSGLAPGTYRLEAHAEGYAPVVLPATEIPPSPRFTLELSRAAQLEGTVVHAEGTPAVGAEVFATSTRYDATVLTDSEGHFAFEVPPGAYTVSSRQGAEAGVLDGLEVDEGDRLRGLKVSLGAGARLSGTVLRKDGSPVMGARVEAWRQAAGSPGSAHRIRALVGTDERGAFSLSPLPVGTYVLGVTLPLGGRLKLKPIPLAAGEQPSLTLVCEPQDDATCQLQGAAEGSPQPSLASIRGRVLHPLGIPVRRVTVNLRPAGWTKPWMPPYEFTGDRFEVHGLAPGLQRFAVLADGMKAVLSVELKPGEIEELEVTVTAGVTLTGRLIDEASRQPLEDGWLSVPLFHLQSSTGRLNTGKDGRFSFDNVPPGEHLLHIRRGARPGAPTTTHPLKLLPDQVNDVGDILVPTP